jgi:hypothetical protein
MAVLQQYCCSSTAVHVLWFQGETAVCPSAIDVNKNIYAYATKSCRYTGCINSFSESTGVIDQGGSNTVYPLITTQV